MTLLVATTNPGKLREIRLALVDVPVEIRSLDDFPPCPEPEETGRTFAENAEQKARYYALRLRSVAAGVTWPTVAEDSGLVIDALDGAPGVLSARYPGSTYPEKFANLYRALAPHPRPWTARFVCALAVVGARDAAESVSGVEPTASTVVFSCEAAVEGEIVPTPRGALGFGYDPIFLFAPYGRTFGEVSDDEKLAVSHRGQAFRMLREWLAKRSATPRSSLPTNRKKTDRR